MSTTIDNMTQLDNPPDPRFGATALDEELRFHFEFLGSHWENTAHDVATVGGGRFGWVFDRFLRLDCLVVCICACWIFLCQDVEWFQNLT